MRVVGVRKKRGECGATIVEMAVVMPLLTVIIAILIDLCFSYMGEQRIRLVASKTARQAALTSNLNLMQANALQNSAETDIRSIFGANQLNVSVSTPFDDASDTVDDKVVRVSVSGAFQHLFLGVLGMTSHQININVYRRYESQIVKVAPP